MRTARCKVRAAREIDYATSRVSRMCGALRLLIAARAVHPKNFGMVGRPVSRVTLPVSCANPAHLLCRVLEEARPVLETTSLTGKTAAARAAAAEALAVLAFVGGEDPAAIDSIMSHLGGLWKGM